LQKTARQLCEDRNKALQASPRDWDNFHTLTDQLLDLLPKLQTLGQQSLLHKLLDTSEIKDWKQATQTKGGWIYAIFELFGSKKSYIGQCSMKRTCDNAMKPWYQLERSPRQRFVEHMSACMSQNHTKDMGYFYNKMGKNPGFWVMVPMSYVPLLHRPHATKLEFHWWQKFQPSYNAIPPGGQRFTKKTTKAMEVQAKFTISNLKPHDFVNRMASKRVGLNHLECLEGLCKFQDKLNDVGKAMIWEKTTKMLAASGIFLKRNVSLKLPLMSKDNRQVVKKFFFYQADAKAKA